ncbi:MAG: glycoside hydrolase family 2 TIM barrel-domain containing protein [Bacteroidales bacterium]|nr:glycoside hydrolase family 2 TIM barrel-domain containing protein [Bacteroidales bacterium]
MCTIKAPAQLQKLDWQIAYHKEEATPPDKWLPAQVPGAVQLDVMRGEEYAQPWWYGDNFRQFDWMESWYFTYKTRFKKPALKRGERLFFFSKGIDYQFKIYLNSQKIWEQEGMFTYVDLDVTDYLERENELKIVVMPIPMIGVPYEKGKETYRQNARESVKPAVSYGWDWHPRLVTRGIWDETGLIVRNQSRFCDVELDYSLNEVLTDADLSLGIEGNEIAGKGIRWLLTDPEGKIVVDKQFTLNDNKSVIHHSLPEIKLWWPNGYGPQSLYSSKLLLLDQNKRVLEQHTRKIGFRKLRLIMNEKLREESSFPKTRSVAPMSLEINNRRIFAKGSNWVHPELFVGLITHELYRKQLILAQKAHFNLLRVWGGGITNKEAFYDICDELGIMVWQEFPLACNNYTDDEKYLKVLEQEAGSIIGRIKKHACLAIWSGGNELFNSWSGMTDQSLALRLLNSLCYEMDRHTPFIYTSPLYGIGHGHYIFYDTERDEDLFQWMARAKNTAYTEFAVPGAANIEVLKSFIPSDEFFPPKLNTAWESHHALRAWQADSWLDMPTLEKYFGKIKTIKELVAYSQLLQCEGLKFIYEEARRQKPYCSMALSWCYQEPWPTAANNSLINWPNEVKPAYHHVAKACRPILASARIPKFEWSAGELFSCDLFMLNDTYSDIEEAKIEVILQYDDKEELLLKWSCLASDGFSNVKGPTATAVIPEMKRDLFALMIRVEGKPEYNSSYLLHYSGNNSKKQLPSAAYYRGETEFTYDNN